MKAEANVNPIYRDPATGGTLFVGNQEAALDAREPDGLLHTLGIAHIIDCRCIARTKARQRSFFHLHKPPHNTPRTFAHPNPGRP